MIVFYDTFQTPLGRFSVACDSGGALLATAFGGLDVLGRRLPPPSPPHDAPGGKPDRRALRWERNAALAREIRRQIAAYFAGERRSFELPLALSGTGFQQRVWARLRHIPFGETRSYAHLASELGQPRAARAVGRANATNPICLIVPCHRVVGADGSMTGFAFGIGIKRELLAHEEALAGA